MRSLLLLLLLMLVPTASCSRCIAWAHQPSSQEMRDAQNFISKLDAFVANEGRSPNDIEVRTIMSGLGLRDDESCRPCYSQQGDIGYTIYFGTSLGESYSFSSEERTWY